MSESNYAEIPAFEQGPRSTIAKVLKEVNGLLLWVCVRLLIAMLPTVTLVIFGQVVMRYIFRSPFAWAEEVSRYLLLWISCLGAAYAVNKGMHISITFVYNKFGERARRVVALIAHVILICFFVICFMKGADLAISVHDQISPGTQISQTWAYSSLPAGFGLMILFDLELLLADLEKIVMRT